MRDRHCRMVPLALLAGSLLLGASGCKKNQPPADDNKAQISAARAAADEARPAAAAQTGQEADRADDRSAARGEVAGKVVEIDTSLGRFKIELDRDKAPKSVANFLRYVKDGHYDGTIFHRVISGFMIQGGGFSTDFQKKPTREPIDNEADNGLLNQRGTVAMARTGDPHSATAQFFVNVVDNVFLNHRSKTPQGWGYTVFGKVTSGMDVVDKIRNTPTGAKGMFDKDCPQTDVVIKAAKIIE